MVIRELSKKEGKKNLRKNPHTTKLLSNFILKVFKTPHNSAAIKFYFKII